MPRYHLNHINLRTADLEKTRDFYADVLGLREGFRPSFPNAGYWMYSGDYPIVHISPSDPASPARTDPRGMGQGLDHFAMWGSGLDRQLATLERHDIDYEKRLAGGGLVIQVFFKDPNGVVIEVGFDPKAEGVDLDTFDGIVR